jgi:hemoglobin
MSSCPSQVDLTNKRALSHEALDEVTIRMVVDRFYALAREDALIGPVFKSAISDAQWQNHLNIIADFWSSLLLGSGRYKGRPLPKHIALPEISDAHFRRWLGIFRFTVTELCSAEIANLFMERAQRIANAFRMNIRMHRSEDLLYLRPLEPDIFDLKTC